MTDYTELKRAASEAKNWGGEVGEGRWYTAECFKRPYFSIPDAEFIAACEPGAVLALIAENDRLSAACTSAEQVINAESKAAAIATGRANLLETERDKLRAEVAGLRTGYEAYEQVNAELKAENERLRDDLEQIQYDANAWRNGEESVWIEVFNSEGDDPFICAISGQITVEQLALIQAEILEYREDYFEKGSGLYVFRCAHYQAHYDNVGMTEPAHWETDFESYSPFPWEEEGAALGQGEQS